MEVARPLPFGSAIGGGGVKEAEYGLVLASPVGHVGCRRVAWEFSDEWLMVGIDESFFLSSGGVDDW